MEAPRKTQYRPTIWYSDPNTGCISERIKSTPRKAVHTPMFMAALFTVAKIQNWSRCPWMDEWIKKMVYTYNRVLFSHEKDVLPFAATWINLEDIMPSGMSWAQRHKYHTSSLTRGTESRHSEQCCCSQLLPVLLLHQIALARAVFSSLIPLPHTF